MSSISIGCCAIWFAYAENRDLAEDLFQKTWVRVMERGHKYEGRHEFSTWLYALARNLTLDYLPKVSPVSLDAVMADEERAPLEPVDHQPSAVGPARAGRVH